MINAVISYTKAPKDGVREIMKHRIKKLDSSDLKNDLKNKLDLFIDDKLEDE